MELESIEVTNAQSQALKKMFNLGRRRGGVGGGGGNTPTPSIR